MWDLFFGPGTVTILDSHVSRAFPVSDAALGSTVYAIEALMGYLGDTDRWRTMPWMVGLFGLLVVPLGIVTIALVIMQPVAVATWCTIWLVTAVAMLVMIPLTLDEVVAMLQFLIRRVREGAGFWRVFFLATRSRAAGQMSAHPTWAARCRRRRRPRRGARRCPGRCSSRPRSGCGSWRRRTWWVSQAARPPTARCSPGRWSPPSPSPR